MCIRDRTRLECPTCRGSPEITITFPHAGVDTPLPAAIAPSMHHIETTLVPATLTTPQEPPRALSPLQDRDRTARSTSERRSPSTFSDARSEISIQQTQIALTTTIAEALHTTALMLNQQQLEKWANSWTTMSQEEWSRKLPQPSSPSTSTATSSNALAPEKETVHLKNLENCKVEDRQTILLDIGAIHNVAGENTVKQMEKAARDAGLQSTYSQRSRVLAVNGVGEGSAPCYQQADIPIAVGYENRPAEQCTYRTNVATGIGCDLPAIMGSLSMEDRDAVLLLRKGRQQIIFPGKEGYKIEWSAGTKICPIRKADSRHYVIECDHWEHAQEPTVSQTFLTTDHWNSTE